MNGDETTSFDYFGQLNQESKVALAFSEVEALIEAFKHHDGASPGSIPVAALKPLAKELGARYGNEKSFADVFGALKADTVSFSEFIQLFVTAHKQKKITKLEAGGTIHSFSEEEKQGYVDYINTSLQGDEGLAHVVPIDPHTMDIFKAVGDGVLLCKLINKGFPMTIDEAKLNIKSPNNWEKNENHDKCIAAAVKLGCSIVNIGGEDLIAGTPHLVMGLIWQIIKKSLLAKVAANLQSESEALDNLPPEQILFKWFNYHLTNAGHKGNVSNWSSDLKDGKKFIVLLSQLDKEKITGEDMESALSASSDLNRASMVVEFAERIGCKEFVTPKTIVEGNPRLNLAFVATLFNKYPHMGPSPEELAKARVQELESELKETTESLASTKQQQHTLSEELTKLQKDFNSKDEQLQEVSRKLENILTERERLQQHVEELLDELATAKTRTEALQKDLELASNERDSLSQQLRDEKEAREAADKKIIELEEDLERTRKEAKDTQDDLLREIERLKKELAEALDENEKLKQKLKEEREAKEALAQELKETNELLEETRAESDEEKTLLLQRIKDLEEEVEQLKEVMDSSLSKAARDKAEALSKANMSKESALSEAERARIAAMKKLQNLLSKVQREGWMHLQEKATFGVTWKKRYFVLQDNFLSFYKHEKAFSESKPLGIIICEECRVYELDEKQSKRPFSFQLDNGKTQYNIACHKAEKMKDWMKAIKAAKKKAVGVKVISDSRADEEIHSPRKGTTVSK